MKKRLNKMESKFSWEFPGKDFYVLRIEMVFIAFLALLVFVFSYFGLGQQWFPALIFTVVFLGIYLVLSYLVQTIRKAKIKYHLTPQHLEIHKTTMSKIKKEKVPLSSVKHHKLTKTFLGGYVATNTGKRHQLFFNTKAEVDKFEALIKKHLKRK